MLNNTDIETRREVTFLPCSDQTLRLIPIQDFEIQKLINIRPPENHDNGQKRYIVTSAGSGLEFCISTYFFSHISTSKVFFLIDVCLH